MNGTGINGTGMDGTGQGWPDGREIAREWAVLVAVAVGLAWLGPFGMYFLPFGQRLVDWLLFAGGGWLCFRPVVAGGGALARATALPRGAAIAGAAAIAAFPTTLLVAATLAGWRLRGLGVGALIDLYPQVLAVGGAVTLLIDLLERRRVAGAPPASEPQPAREPEPEPAPAPAPDPVPAVPAPSFFDRIPPALGRELLCLENEDHYLRIHTALGSGLILMRLRDAAAELAAADGLRVHRGWWVARAAVVGVERRERAMALRLCNGLEVPVARSAVAELRAAGWL